MAQNTMEAEWVASSKAIEMAEGPRLLLQFLRGRTELEQAKDQESDAGAILCDNRSEVLSGRKPRQELHRSTRHIATRRGKVLEHGSRVVFVPTQEQRADALAKRASESC
ncbi:unnamed protein product [Amoebophrya sp. A25]|nr:unnamed protein product [Amoebophrya sp. A25]|eukprot:GSA25T00017083001.1